MMMPTFSLNNMIDASAGLTLTSTASATDLVPYLVVASGRILLGTPQLAFG